MPVTAFMYGNAAKHAYTKNIDWVNDDIRVALVTAYTPDQDHEYWNVITKTEATGTAYTAGGQALGTKTVLYDTASNTLQLKAANTVWATSTIANATYAIVYDNTPATNKPLIAYVNFGGAFSSSAGDFTIAWAGGVVASVQAL